MAKKGGKSKGFISQGLHSSVSARITNQLRSEYLASSDRVMNQLRAWKQNKNVVLTIENPNKNETNKRFIKVKAFDYWGSPKKFQS
jgi:hypothetical protein